MDDQSQLGRWIRHYRKARGLTLGELGSQIGITASHLSMIETGRREPRLSTMNALAEALGVTPVALLAPEAPTHRDSLEVALIEAQDAPEYAALGLPRVRPTAAMPDSVLEALNGLHAELFRRDVARKSPPMKPDVPTSCSGER